MKKTLYLVLFFFLQYVVTQAQTFTVPDANFFNAILTVQSSCSTCVTNYVTREFNAACIDGLNITNLGVSNKNIANLSGVEYFVDLTYLYCNNNQLTSLTFLPSLLIDFRCSQNQLTSLPVLPNGLKYLYCSYNPMTTLPILPTSLLDLHTEYTLITDLPPLPMGLKTLTAKNTNLNKIPILPQNLSALEISNCKIMELPALPNTIFQLYCDNTYITALPRLPYSLKYLSLNGSLVSCLPFLPDSVQNINYGNTSIACLPNKPLNLNPIYNNTPLCTPQNSICANLASDNLPETYPPSAPRQAQTQILNLPHTQVNTDTVRYAKVKIGGIDMAILGGDVVLGEVSSLPLWYNTFTNNDSLFLWEGKIPYDTLVEVGNTQVGISQIDSISKAIRYYNTQAALRGVKLPFVPRVPSDAHWVKFKHYENGYASRMGRIEDNTQVVGEQYIWVDTAGYSGKILHELTHTVGLYHEHQRESRNVYVALSPQNVHQEYLESYSQIRDVQQTPYDYASLMHYWCYGFSLLPPVDGLNLPPDNLLRVMQPTFSMGDKQMGQRTFYTDEDIADINQLYPDGIIGGVGVNGTGVFTLQLPTIPTNMVISVNWAYTCTENCSANTVNLSNVVGNPNRINIAYSNNISGFYNNSRGFLEATATLTNGQVKKYYRYLFRGG